MIVFTVCEPVEYMNMGPSINYRSSAVSVGTLLTRQLWWDSYSWSATCLIFWTMHISNNIYANKDHENFRFRFPYPLKLIKIRAAMFRKEYLKWGISHAPNHWDKKLCFRTNKVFSTCFKEVTSIDLLGHALDYNHMR